jgi:hypothetical protein
MRKNRKYFTKDDPTKGPKLPPRKFDEDYTFFKDSSYNTKQRVRIAFDPRTKSYEPNGVLYFVVILYRRYRHKWRHIVVFDTYHKGKVYVHGHRRVGLSRKRDDIKGIPQFDTLKNGLDWVTKHLKKDWHSYVKMFLEDLDKERK